MASLKKIEIAKRLFIFEVEDGTEAFIPWDLSMERFPQCMRFYDPIIGMLQENISKEIKLKNKTKNIVAFMIHREHDTLLKIKEFVGIEDKADKLIFEYAAINEKPELDIDHTKSYHSTGLQMSKYIAVDDQIEKQHYVGVNVKKYINDPPNITTGIYR